MEDMASRFIPLRAMLDEKAVEMSRAAVIKGRMTIIILLRIFKKNSREGLSHKRKVPYYQIRLSMKRCLEILSIPVNMK